MPDARASSTGGREAGMGTFRMALGLGLAVVVAVVGLGLLSRIGVDLPSLPNPFDDGHDGDDQASGTLQVQGQRPTRASDVFVVKIGEGEATVTIKAHQNWDTPGGPISGDFQSTNGTASVRDPDHHDQPATITVGVEYCAQGQVSRTGTTDEDGQPAPASADEITFDMGSLFVCDVEWQPTEENEAAFVQDDTPDDFQGAFEERIKNAATTAVAASECPDSLEEQFTAQDYLDFVAESLARQEGVDPAQVTVTPGQAGTTSAATQEDLQAALDRFVQTDDLDIDAFSGSGSAIADSCFIDTSGQPLDSLDQVPVPDPRDL